MNNPHKKYKRPKQRTLSTTKPETSKQRHHECRAESPESLCPLAAKDSEWVDILQTPNSEQPEQSSSNLIDEEEILQLVECEEGPEMKPLAVMFPGLLDKDPRTLQGILNKAMSTTEVTKHLVDLGQKANFTFMKQADRLIPKDKQWLESLTENSNSFSSMVSGFYSGSISSDYEADNEATLVNSIHTNRIKTLLERRKEAATGKTNSDELAMCMKQIIIEVIQLCGNDVCVNDNNISADSTATSDVKKTEE